MGDRVAPGHQGLINSLGAICWVPRVKSSALLWRSVSSDFHGQGQRLEREFLRLVTLKPIDRSRATYYRQIAPLVKTAA